MKTICFGLFKFRLLRDSLCCIALSWRISVLSILSVFQMWEKGIELCKELVRLYEEELFDYERLSVIMVWKENVFPHQEGCRKTWTVMSIIIIIFDSQEILQSVSRNKSTALCTTLNWNIRQNLNASSLTRHHCIVLSFFVNKF